MINQRRLLELKDKQKLEVVVLTYPISPDQQIQLIELLQEEWDRTDVDWLQSMRGMYSDTLRTHVALGLIDRKLVATASIALPIDHPEVAVIEDVMTHKTYRGLGIAANLTNHLVQIAWKAGCRSIYLGNAIRQNTVYERIGFKRVSGAIMRCALPGQSDPEITFYAPGQPTTIRSTTWGHLPGVACLLAQPLNSLVVDFNRGLVSSRYISPLRCVSNFTVLWYDVQAQAGQIETLIGAVPNRVLGLASLTPQPSPLRKHIGVIDGVTHDNYSADLTKLLERLVKNAQQKKIQLLQAYVSTTDLNKEESFKAIGLSTVTTFSKAILLDNKPITVKLMQRQLN